jgi:hypothetical protein
MTPSQKVSIKAAWVCQYPAAAKEVPYTPLALQIQVERTANQAQYPDGVNLLNKDKK